MLKVRDLVCGYNSRFFLKDINLEIENGAFIGIIGPNGSGKTTLLRAVTRILKPRSGQILLDGKDIWQLSFRDLAMHTAVVSQSPPAAAMTVEEFVLMGRTPHYKKFQLVESNKDIEIAERSMGLTDTLKLKDRLMQEISGGERQLVLIARALTQEPKLLLLDEPTSHLDITHQVSILDLIARLNKTLGLTVLTVLHDLNLASEYCHKLVLLNKGRIYKTGTAEEVIDYRIIEEVYKTIVVVKANPISSKPYIFIVSEEGKKTERSEEDQACKGSEGEIPSAAPQR